MSDGFVKLTGNSTDKVTLFTALLIFLAVLTGIGLFAWWAFTWSTHTLVWMVFIFGSVLGSVRVRAGK